MKNSSPCLFIGAVVQLTLSAAQAEEINKIRHSGNPSEVGQVLPLIVTRIHNNGMINGHLFCDGLRVEFLENVTHGNGLGQWHWPLVDPAVALAAESDRYGDWAVWRDRALFAEEAKARQSHEIESLKRQLELACTRESNLINARDSLILDLSNERGHAKRFQDQLTERDQRLASQAVILDEAQRLIATVAEMKATFTLWDAMAQKLRES